MSTPTVHHDISTVLAREPCAGCGAPLGADQRYCLSCGIPHSGTRLPFLDVLHAEAGAVGAVHPGAPVSALLRMPALASSDSAQRGGWWGGRDGEGGVAVRLRESMGLFALLGVLLLALLIGLLLGHWVSGGSRNLAVVPTKQVVEIKGLPTALAAAPATGTAVGTTDATSETSSPDEAKSGAHAAHAANPTVSKLAKSTGKAHAKAVEKALSKSGSLSTGGPPPPKETNKPAGDGSPVATIE